MRMPDGRAMTADARPLDARAAALAADTPWPTLALAAAAVCICAIGGVVTLVTHPAMVDLEIPLRAADRWRQGLSPYLASAFSADATAYDLPFLYPPPVLPLLVPLLAVPRALVVVAWLTVLLGATFALLRRLGLPWWATPVAVSWVPFSEGLVGGNVQVVLVAAFAAVFLGPSPGPWRTEPRDPGTTGARSRRSLGDGLAAAITPALKISQPHGWVGLLRRQPSAALVGIAAVAAIALVTLPLTGTEPWRAWLEQVGRAADPGWPLRGSSLVQVFPGPIPVILTLLSVGAVLLVPPRRLAAGIGLLLVLGVPSLRNYGVLFLLPAMLEIRREVALVAVIVVGLGVAPAVWAGILLVTTAWLADVGGVRLRAPGRRAAPGQ